MADKKRWFWDSKLANWLETELFVLAYWFTDKRYPIDDVLANTQPKNIMNDDPIASSDYGDWDTAPPPLAASEALVKKRAKKTTAKKTTKKKTKNANDWHF